MGHESRIELCQRTGPPFCFAGFGTDRLRREQAMKTAGRENPIHGVTLPRNRAPGAVGQNRSRSIKWAAKQEKCQPLEMCFFLTSTFIEHIETYAFILTRTSLRSSFTAQFFLSFSLGIVVSMWANLL